MVHNRVVWMMKLMIYFLALKGTLGGLVDGEVDDVLEEILNSASDSKDDAMEEILFIALDRDIDN